MKKVRFLTPCEESMNNMGALECHSPRPFMEIPLQKPPLEFYERVLPYSSDPLQRFETSNTSPYPVAKKTSIQTLHGQTSQWSPSNDLDLSMLDTSNHIPRKPIAHTPINSYQSITPILQEKTKVLSSIENSGPIPPNVLMKDNSFFIRKDNIDRYRLDTNALQKDLRQLPLDKENNPLAKKNQIITLGKIISPEKVSPPQLSPVNITDDVCRCHHCVRKVQESQPQCLSYQTQKPKQSHNHCPCISQPLNCFHCTTNVLEIQKTCNCEQTNKDQHLVPQNAVDKKIWAIQQYEQSQNPNSMEVEKRKNVVKEKREPTVADLFKIIKLQNEQLQLLQDKVDKFITTSSKNYMTKEVAVQNTDPQYTEQHKISIGVMTSFEVVTTSTVINKEYIQQTTENAHIQCNRSQISIKEVISKAKPVNLNFLDGITPMERHSSAFPVNFESGAQGLGNDGKGQSQQIEQMNDDKTLNEFSLYNVQVDNATTPLISPEQSMYLDVRDYSDTDSSSDDQSNVGWTYYNKVMTHVNGMLQDSDMPSSASALYRNTRQQCLQMQVDKTNLSVTKRVKFGDEPLGIHQPHIYAPSTETSMKMNQLAAKYLRTGPVNPQPIIQNRPTTKEVEMSFATKNYMERHKLLQGPSRPTSTNEIPKFLDITALKLQPKLL